MSIPGQPIEQVLTPTQMRRLLNNSSTAGAGSAFPAYSRIVQRDDPPLKVDAASAANNYAIVEAQRSVVGLSFFGEGSDNQEGRAKVFAVHRNTAALGSGGGGGSREYISRWLGDFTFIVSANLPGTVNGIMGGSGVLMADTITSTNANATQAVNVISPADDTEMASVEITHGGAEYIAVLLHRNNSLTNVNGFIWFS